jgi:hypothetical protein
LSEKNGVTGRGVKEKGCRDNTRRSGRWNLHDKRNAATRVLLSLKRTQAPMMRMIRQDKEFQIQLKLCNNCSCAGFENGSFMGR